jgi:hypothetical protein
MAKTIDYRHDGLVVAIWLFWSVLLTGAALLGSGDLVSDPDDYMRMAQVHDWLAGQSWFDVSQRRINPPFGGDMHWSRWLDVPIAAMYLAGSTFLKPGQADQFAFIITPILLLALLMVVMASITRKLTNDTVALVAIFLIPTFPLLMRQFLPGRIDHHSWQILMAALALWGVLHKSQVKGGIIIGVALGFWMHVSIEGLPFAAAFGGLLAFLHFFPQFSTHGPRDMRLPWFAGALTVSSGLLLASTRTSSALSTVYCDAVAWPLVAAMATSTFGILFAVRIFAHRQIAMLTVAMAAALGAAIYVGASGSCALDPFGNLSPLVRSFWHETITEGLPIHRQAAAIITLLLFVPLIACLALRLSWAKCDASAKKICGSLAFLLLFATLMSLYVQRTGAVAQLFAVPLFGLLVMKIVDWAKQIRAMPVRVLVTASLLVCLLPMTAFFAGSLVFAAPKKNLTIVADKTLRPCSTAELQRLPKGRIFTTMAAGPDILFHTQHSVFVSGYHRNHVQMDRLIATMLGAPESAEKPLRAAAIDYVVICPSHFETKSYLASGKANFAASLLSPTHPDWLLPVDGFRSSAMRVYRLTPAIIETSRVEP